VNDCIDRLDNTMASQIRAKALEKIASLSAASSSPIERSDLDRLCRACHSGARGKDYANGVKSTGSLGKVPMVGHAWLISMAEQRS
jgi:phosphatidylinositol 4-kinase